MIPTHIPTVVRKSSYYGLTADLSRVVRNSNVLGDDRQQVPVNVVDALSNRLGDEIMLVNYMDGKANDFGSLLKVFLSRKEYQNASDLLKKHEGSISSTDLKIYADSLFSNGSYETALPIYRKVIATDRYLDMIERLATNALKLESLYCDASFYLWLLGTEMCKFIPENAVTSRCESSFQDSHLYYAYHLIHCYCYDSFTLHQPEVLLHASLFLLNSLTDTMTPLGISRANILYTLAKQARLLGANDLAKCAYTQLHSQKCSYVWGDSIELELMMLQAAGETETLEMSHSVCYRCGASNPLLNLSESAKARGDRCVYCLHPFKRCFLTFAILPIVEFIPGNSIGKNTGDIFLNKLSESKLATDQYHGKLDFGEALLSAQEQQLESEAYTPLILKPELLHQVCDGATFMVKTPTLKYFRNVLPEVSITLSPNEFGCFFKSDEYEFFVLKHGRCPFSRTSAYCNEL